MSSIERFIADLRRFDRNKEVMRWLRAEIRRPVPEVRKAIRARAVATLPAGNGLGRWVAASRITASIKLSGRTAGVRLRGARKSARKQSDLAAIDRGRVRAPSWGRRGVGDWHVQRVTPAFFTAPAVQTDAWRAACERALDQATDMLRNG